MRLHGVQTGKPSYILSATLKAFLITKYDPVSSVSPITGVCPVKLNEILSYYKKKKVRERQSAETEKNGILG